MSLETNADQVTGFLERLKLEAAVSSVIDINPAGDLILNVGQEESPEKMKRLRIASAIMTNASPVFDRMLNGHFLESQLPLSKTDPPTLYIHDDPDAMLTFCQILHHHMGAREVVTSAQMVEVAKLADMYGCQGAVELWFTNQLQQRSDIVAGLSVEESAAIIQASYLLNANEIFYGITKTVIKFSPSHTDEALTKQLLRLGDTVPSGFTTCIGVARMVCLGRIEEACHDLVNEVLGPFDEVDRLCNCKATRVGKFIIAARAAGLVKHMCWAKRYPFVGVSARPVTRSVHDTIKALETIAQKHFQPGSDEKCSQTNCQSQQQRLDLMILAKANDLMDNVPGFCLTCMKTKKDYRVSAPVRAKCEKHNLSAGSGFLGQLLGHFELLPPSAPPALVQAEEDGF